MSEKTANSLAKKAADVKRKAHSGSNRLLRRDPIRVLSMLIGLLLLNYNSTVSNY